MELDDIALAWRWLEQRLDQHAALTDQVLGDLRSHNAPTCARCGCASRRNCCAPSH
ncbi:putative membrane protein [Xanthomonas oryzae pv. oryzicola BLS256]|uniref:Putative membrane protein n=1 Tax=Xanthomonas oryzae pv. oryzicola (strain BLS256) TaxID=383407 RepID=G7TKU2_XANOB|nr:putative membrane protein [Xanthomonas oryzae pv. oryzicola BLS256]